MEKQGMGSNAPSPKYSPKSRNASHEWTGWNHEKHENHEGGGSRTTNEHERTRMGITSCNNLMFFQMI